MTHETHLPTQQVEAETEVWLPRPDENILGQESDQKAPPRRSQQTHRLKYPKSKRLRKRRDFKRISYDGKRLVGKLLCIDVRMASTLRLGITASSRFGNAPERNRFKRLVREVFRRNAPHLPPCLEIHVLPRQKAKKASYQAICDEMLQLICRL